MPRALQDFAKTWWSAAELAALALPGFPASKRGMNKLAAREGWLARPRVARGGGMEYALHALPGPVIREIERRRAISQGCTGRPKSLRKRARIVKLKRPRGRPKGTSVIDRDEQLQSMIIAQMHARPISAPALYEWLRVHVSRERLPSLRRLQAWMSAYEAREKAQLMHLRDRDSYRNRYALALGRADAMARHVNALWEIDSSPTDVILSDGKRHAIIGIIDVFSRRVLFHIAQTSTSHAIAAALRRAILCWGVPDAIKTDNGADYVSHHIRSSLQALGIAHHICRPGQPQEKPHIERVFHTLQHDLVEHLPGFIGHSVAERKALSGRQALENSSLSSSALQAFFDSWCDGYHLRRHATLGTSPMLKAASCTHPIARVEGERVLDILLSPLAGTRQVAKRGLRVDGAHYWSDALIPHMGRQVSIRRCDEDLGRIYVFDEQDTFICEATSVPLSGISRRDLALAAKKRQAEVEAEWRAQAKRLARAYKVGDLAQDVIRARTPSSSRILEFPKPEKRRETEATRSIHESYNADAADFTRNALSRDADAALSAIRAADAGDYSPAVQNMFDRADFHILVDWLKTLGRLDAAWTPPTHASQKRSRI